jgi:hypothetical protein
MGSNFTGIRILEDITTNESMGTSSTLEDQKTYLNFEKVCCAVEKCCLVARTLHPIRTTNLCASSKAMLKQPLYIPSRCRGLCQSHHRKMHAGRSEEQVQGKDFL